MTSGYCDGHGCERPDVRACGRDANGDPDAPDLCWLCRKEGERGKVYDRSTCSSGSLDDWPPMTTLSP